MDTIMDTIMDTSNKKWLILATIILYVSAYAPFIYKIFSRKNVKQEFKKEYYYLLVVAFACSLGYSYYTDNILGMLYSAIKIAIALAIIVGKFVYP